MTCMCVSIRDWSEGDPASLHPFVVRCFAETYDGKNCQRCNGLHKPCEITVVVSVALRCLFVLTTLRSLKE